MEQVSFSASDSYLTLRHMTRARFPGELGDLPEGVYLRLVHGGGRPLCFRLVPLMDGDPCPYTLDATAACVTFAAEGGVLRVTFGDGDTLVAQGNGLGLRLDMPVADYEYAAEYPAEKRCLLNTSASRAQFMVSAVQGGLRLDAPYVGQHSEYIHCDLLPEDTAPMRASVECFRTVWEKRACPMNVDVDAACERLRKDFDRFCAGFPAPPKRYADTMRLALYLLWSSTVPPLGYLRRRGVLMSNSWMTRVWTWDSAINAMALSMGDSALAMDQLMLPFDDQQPSGLLPDYVSPYDVMWNFTKPPVHGLALSYMLEQKVGPEAAATMYRKLNNQVSYWLTYTDSDGDGIPEYGHGNDCGWDNCTSFEAGPPVEGPDLTAYLVLEMETLSALAARLGKPRSALRWKRESGVLLTRLLAHSWSGERFEVYQSGTHRVSPRGDCLYPFLPLVLGHRLPAEVYRTLVDGLKREGRFLTPFGLATESVTSPCYQSDGYWRGPVWAPPMLLMIMGIADGGDTEFATLLADRFCDMVAANGFGENFDALTGASLRDPSYTWTASVFVILACRYAAREPGDD
jgi:putative isomerase